MLIVTEGMDGSGKSSLIEELESRIDGATVIHRGPLRSSPLEEYEYSLHDYDIGHRSILCDRWHVGELFYGPLYRGESQLSDAQAFHVELYLQSRGAIKVMLDTPMSVVSQRLSRRGEDFLRPEHRGLAWDWYREYAEEHQWTVFPWQYSEGDLLNLISSADIMSAQTANLPRGYVGHPWPEYVLVCTVDPLVTDPRSQVLPMTPVRGTSQHYMMSALQLAGARNFGILYARAGSVNGKNRFLTDWNVLSNPLLITLGTAASTIVREAGLEHMETYTPEQVRSRQPENTAEYIKEILSYGTRTPL